MSRGTTEERLTALEAQADRIEAKLLKLARVLGLHADLLSKVTLEMECELGGEVGRD